jgi:hypothetical protein
MILLKRKNKAGVGVTTRFLGELGEGAAPHLFPPTKHSDESPENEAGRAGLPVSSSFSPAASMDE